jgi:nuclear transport factor 2 (NTF2) superfamily protein
LSCPEIAIHKKYPNGKHEETRYVKRTQKITQCLLNYKLFKKLNGTTYSYRSGNYGIQNRTTVVQWLRKFGNFDWENKHHLLCQSRRTEDNGLEAKVKLLEKQKSFWNDKPLLQIKAIILI